MQRVKYCPKCAGKLETRLVGGIERKACPAAGCNFVNWDNPLPVVAALIEYQGQIVLARNAKWPHGIFSLVTGFLERGEAPACAVVREVKEELDLDSEVAGFVGHYPYSQMNQIILAFSVRATGALKTNDEIAETRLITIDELRDYDFGPLFITSAVVKDWLAQTPNASPQPTSGIS